MPLAFFTRSQSGAVVNRIHNDVREAQSLVSAALGSVALNTLSFTAAIVTMAALSPLLTLLVLATAPVLLVPFRRFSGRIASVARQLNGANSRMSTFLTELLNVGGAMLRLLFGDQQRDIREFEDAAGALRDAVRARNVTFAKSAWLPGTLGVAGYTVVYLVGGIGAAQGTLSVGTVVAPAGLVKLAYDPLIAFSTQGLNVSDGLVAFERVYEVLDFPSSLEDPVQPVRIRRPIETLEFRDVWFRHPDAAESTLPSLVAHDDATTQPDRRWALQGVSWTARRGSTTAIVGPTGAGKSTLIALIARLYDPTRGSIHVNGVDLRDMGRDDVRATVGVVTQDTYVFNDTLADNLRLAKPDASVDELLEACRAACLEEPLARMPDEPGHGPGRSRVPGLRRGTATHRTCEGLPARSGRRRARRGHRTPGHPYRARCSHGSRRTVVRPDADRGGAPAEHGHDGRSDPRAGRRTDRRARDSRGAHASRHAVSAVSHGGTRLRRFKAGCHACSYTSRTLTPTRLLNPVTPVSRR